MKNAFVTTAVLMGLMLVAPFSQADPPPETCKIKIWHCNAAYTGGINEAIIHVFNGDDDQHLWAVYENAKFKEGFYMNAYCSHKHCDIRAYNVGWDIWRKNYCVPNLYLQMTAPFKPDITKTKPSGCEGSQHGAKHGDYSKSFKEKLP